MSSTLLVLLSFLIAAHAAATTTSVSTTTGTLPVIPIFLGANDPAPYYGSVISANPTATTLNAGCTRAPTVTGCFVTKMDLTISNGGSTYEFTMTESALPIYNVTEINSVTCTLRNSQSADCNGSRTLMGDDAPSGGLITISRGAASGPNLRNVGVTITAGVDKLAAATSGSAMGKSKKSSSGAIMAKSNEMTLITSAGGMLAGISLIFMILL